MIEQRLPDIISPLKLARQGRSLQGRLALNQMSRLTASLVSDDGRVEVEVQFGFDSAGVAVMRGRVTAELQVVCQRCMEPMALPLSLEMMVGFAADESRIDKIADDYEPCLLEDEQVALADLVEDELLLALPIVPVHEDEGCRRWMADNPPPAPDTEQEEKKNPFAVLADLKRKS